MNDALMMGIAPSVPAAAHMSAAELNAAVGHNVGNLAFVHGMTNNRVEGLLDFADCIDHRMSMKRQNQWPYCPAQIICLPDSTWQLKPRISLR